MEENKTKEELRDTLNALLKYKKEVAKNEDEFLIQMVNKIERINQDLQTSIMILFNDLIDEPVHTNIKAPENLIPDPNGFGYIKKEDLENKTIEQKIADKAVNILEDIEKDFSLNQAERILDIAKILLDKRY